LLIENPGILTTLQDMGRRGFQKFGITTGGAMDTAALLLINILLGNDGNDAGLEMHFPAPRLRFESPAICAIGGADFGPELHGKQIKNWRTFTAEKGDCISFAKKLSGSRCYLSVKGGFAVDPWLGSRSTNLAAHSGGIEGRRFEAGDRLHFRAAHPSNMCVTKGQISDSLIPNYSGSPTVGIIPGAEFDELGKQGRSHFLSTEFKVTGRSDRMGYRLSGESITLSKPREMISSAVPAGTIQLLPDGQLIVLMADHQTTGGYPRLAHVITHDLPLLAQLDPNDRVTFKETDINTAEELLLRYENDLSFLRAACRLQSNP